MKIIHISDIHIKRSSDVDLIRFNTIIDVIIRNKYPDGTTVVMTGDLVNNGYTPCSGKWTNPVHDGVKKLKAAGYNERVLVIPGNHDYGVGIGITDFEHNHLVRLIEYFKVTFYNDAAAQYPRINQFGNYLFIGLDSTAAALQQMELERLFTSEGRIGDEQTAELKKALVGAKSSGKKVVVYLHHHPFHNKKDGLKLLDAAEFLKAIDGLTTMLLYGHVHRENNYGDDGYFDNKIDRIYNAGSSTNTDNYKNWESFYRVIDLDTDPYTAEIVKIPVYKLELHNNEEISTKVQWKLTYTVDGEVREQENTIYEGWIHDNTEIPYIAENIQFDLQFENLSFKKTYNWPDINSWKNGNCKYIELKTTLSGDLVLKER
jgi:3',5'-cyclic AMP phosphodiesterase CpdA